MRSLLADQLRPQHEKHYARPDCVAEVRKEIATYKRFKKLMEEWIDLGIEASKLLMKVSHGG